MTQAQLNRAVARATGESSRTIARRGFNVFDPFAAIADLEPADSRPQILDWDEVEAQHRQGNVSAA